MARQKCTPGKTFGYLGLPWSPTHTSNIGISSCLSSWHWHIAHLNVANHNVVGTGSESLILQLHPIVISSNGVQSKAELCTVQPEAR
jgi:hypothetical protein